MVEGKPVREGIRMYQTIHRHMNSNNQSAKPKADLNDVLIRHRAVLRSALPSQIIEALDEQVEKMRKDQIRKRKEWQIKYQQHLKQQRAVYNLDDRGNRDRDEDEEEEEEEEPEIANNNFMEESSLSSPSRISNKSVSTDKENEQQHRRRTKKASSKSPNKMLTSPSLSNHSHSNHHKASNTSLASLTSASSFLTSPASSHRSPNEEMESLSDSNVSNSHSVNVGVESVHSSKLKKVKLFNNKRKHSKTTPSLSFLTSALSMGAGLGGGLAPNIDHNIHKYHKYHTHLRYHKSDGPLRGQRRRKGERTHSDSDSISNPTPTLKRGSDVGGASSYDQCQHQQQQPYHRESDSADSASSAPIKIYQPFCSEDNLTLYYKYKDQIAGMTAGMSRRGTLGRIRKRSRPSDSPKMTLNLFDLHNSNEFVTAKDAQSVVTNTFTSAHDTNFKLFENHF